MALRACLLVASLAAAHASHAAGDHCGVGELREPVLQLVNEARARGQRCGADLLPPAPPLKWDPRLFSAAERHSHDMASGNYFDHVDTEGRRVGRRVAEQGYPYRVVGENLAAGDGSPQQVIAGWLRSESHCRTLLRADFTDVAMACVERPDATWVTYWTMVLARK